jgi:soluble lytic murein transglycosylase-like protein
MPKLHPHIGVPVRKHRVLPALATVAILLVVEGLGVSELRQLSPLEGEKNALQQQVRAQPVTSVLSQSDRAHYRAAFALQRAGRYEEADAVAAQVSDPLLKGVLLGERYLTPGNAPSFSELALWLARYGDHAQAAALYHLARMRTPVDADFLTEPQITATLKGFSNGQDRSALAGEKRWVLALAAFRRHDMPAAAAHLGVLLAAREDNLSSDDRAAVAFWAYRATLAAGDAKRARKYLDVAAEEQPGFYSILARQIAVTQASLPSDSPGPADMESFLTRKPVLRAMALKAIGQDALAEKELRTLFSGSAEGDRKHLAQLAGMLNLPAAEMRMAVAGNYDTKADEARYPLPRWTPTLGYHIEPALLFAIMRQESGFNPNAKSASGAMGVMQLMPATAHAMARDARMEMSAAPAVSMALGQHYLERLMDMSAISDNLVYVIGAYNAGPGAMEGWQKSLHAGDDPLLFIESIPSVETRDYVVHVMGNYWVYSELLGGYENTSAAALAQNRWPHYERSDRQMVSMLSHLNPGGPE